MGSRHHDEGSREGASDRAVAASPAPRSSPPSNISAPPSLQRFDPASFYNGEFDGKSSIGPVDGIYQVGSRIRGVYKHVVNTEQDLNRLLKVMRYLESLLVNDRERISVRAKISNDLLDSPAIIAKLGKPPEAIVSRSDRKHSFVWLGKNSEELGRTLAPEAYNACYRRIEEARADAYTDAADRTVEFAGIINAGGRECFVPGYKDAGKTYRVAFVNFNEFKELTELQQEQGYRLMATFGYSESDVKNLLKKEQNLVALTFLGEKVVGVTVAERATVPFSDGSNLNIIEITDAIVDNHERGNRLYFSSSRFTILGMLHACAQQGIDVDYVYGESNLGSKSVLKSAFAQKRIFSTEAKRRFNTFGMGILPNHAVINDHLASMVVTHFDEDELARMKGLFAVGA